MKKLYLRLLVANVIGNDDRKKAIKFFLLAFFFCCFSYTGFADVTIIAATGGTSICSNRAVGGGPTAGFTTLGQITITEGTQSDFAGAGTDVIILNAPTGWQFSAVVPTFGYTTGANVTGVTGVITSSTLTITITTNGNAAGDQITIQGLQVQATSGAAANGNIYASSVTGVAGITAGAAGSNFGNVSLTTLVTPAVTIAASPGSLICAGTNTMFTPTPTGGGASPFYSWALNGVTVSSGTPFYLSGSLASGNTIVCTMTSSSGCVVPGAVNSNTITMSVTPNPSGITGVTNVCPLSITALSDATPSGAWSSVNGSVATVTSTGVVTGVTAGSTLISYTVGGCAATTSVTVNTIPITPVLTPSVSTVCNNGNLTIIASGIATPPTISSNNFNSSLGLWTVDNTGSIGTTPASAWKQCVDGFANSLGIYHSPDNTGFTMSNADASGSGSTTSSQLISPVFSLVGYSSATLTFQHAYQAYFADYNVEVDVSTDGGSSWNLFQNYIGTNIGNNTNFVPASLTLNAYIGQPNLRIRFYYYSGWGYYWVLDNMAITGTSSGVVPSWSPVTYLFTDAACTTPYTTGTLANTVYMHPTSVTTATPISYTATASNVGCTSAGTNTVTVEPAPGTFSGNTNVCVGLISALSNTVGGGSWSSDNTAVATVNPANGVVSGVSIGSANITYTLAGGCAVATAVNVFPAPSAITGITHVCAGSIITLTATPTGGTWTSGNIPVANVVSGTGTVTGATPGNVIITYTLGAGCISIASVTVNQVPSAITGPSNVCTGSTITLSNTVSSGTWSSSNTSFATIVTGTGVLSGVAAGAANISYTLAGNCTVVYPVTVYPLPSSISGIANICRGLTTTLSNTVAGGVWSSGSTTIASVSTGTNIINGVAVGTAVITYTIGSSCIATASVTVNPLPSSITGSVPVCAGLSISLSDVTASGTWSSSNTTTASITNSGFVTGGSAGTAIITYMLATGCIATQSVLVNPLPALIAGNNAVCINMTTGLSDVSNGGTWSSSITSVATVVPGSGLVFGVSAGVTNITYKLATGCIQTQTLTVNSLPSAIIGNTNVCVGLTTALSNTVGGGNWTTGNSFATVNPSSGVVSGVTAGVSSVTYTLGTTCMTTASLQVNPLSPITGIANVCVGLTTLLSDATSGGTWSSTNTTFATVLSGSGSVSGISAGTLNINYILPTGCATTTSLVVNPIPAAISGNPNVCLTSSITLSDGGGGTWSSSNTNIAPIGVNNGSVFGLSLGTVTITYSLSAGCIATTSLTVNPLPASISGLSNVCVASTLPLSDGTPSGTWSSSNTAFATINSSGVVTGVAAGPVVITYTLPTGCISTKNITVNPLPAGITGVMNVCAGLTTTLSNITNSGTWSSSSTNIATVNPSSGVVTGVIAGTTFISYNLGTGCLVTTSVLVNPLPLSITGIASTCVGLSTTLSDVTSGGAWSSSNTNAATINLSGLGTVTSVSSGTTTVTYTLGTGCLTTRTVVVNPLPNIITGNTPVCVGLSATLSDAGGGTWSSNSTGIATVVAATGVATGSSAGTTTVTYTLPTGCIATASLQVHPLPAFITGVTSICDGFLTSLSDVTASGTWSSSNTGVAIITPSGLGIVTSVSAGTTMITYTLGTGCIATRSVTVNPLPNSITGTTAVCVGLTTTLSDAGSGTWSSSSTSIATVAPTTGVVTGVAAGPVNITYTLPTGCIATSSVIVHPLPSSILGSATVCYTLSTTLSDVTSGGTWSSSNTIAANIDVSSGLISTVSPGITTITYILGTGCIMTKMVTVNPLPAIVTGQSDLCILSTALMSDATGTGTWSSSNSTIAAIGVSSGIVTGISSGSVIITYKLNTGCIAVKSVTVNALPPAIGGITGICFGTSTNLSDASTGGTWSTTNTTVAIVDLNSGNVFGASTGSATITYTVDTGCSVTTTVTVNSLPSAITGGNSVCVGFTTALSDAGSGTWSSSNTSIATVGTSTGVVKGVAPGTINIIYTLPTGCTANKNITVNAMPSAITGITGLCLGTTTTLSDAVAGGTWTSVNTSVAIVIDGLSGIFLGGLPGATTISYSLPGNCVVTTSVTVNTLPGGITGINSVCSGLTISLTDATGGGSWSSSNTTVATVSNVGVVHGISAGTVNIYYTLNTGCAANKTVTVYSSPSAIAGATAICLGSSAALSNSVAGGVWTSTNTAVATIDPSAGLLTSISSGSSTVSYTMPGSCIATVPITVNPSPTNITGTPVTCIGLTTALSNGVGGGTWSSSNTFVATVIAGTGVVKGVASGTTNITYGLSGGCMSTVSVTVNPPPSAIFGNTNVCLGIGTTLSNTVAGGVWSSSNTSVATIDPTFGFVTGVSAGPSTISYSISAGACTISVPVTVYPSPTNISGNTLTCIGLTTTLSDAVTGGAWSSSNTSVATVIAGSGVVKGVSAGTTIISYSLPGGCITTTSVTVDPPPSAIFGSTSVCIGSGTTLSNSVLGGVWSSSNNSVAFIDPSSGAVATFVTGTVTVSYTISGSCTISTPLTVNPVPATITGNFLTCVGLTTTLSDAVTGGSWTSSNTSIATVTPGTGIVRGVAQGTAIITYKLSGGCLVTTSVLVHPLPSAIAGNPNVCFGSTTTLSDAISGGTWSSSSTSFAIVGATTGVVFGLSPGSSTITYSIVSGCATTVSVTINNLPSGISGVPTVCVGTTTHLSDVVTGGTWSSGNTSIATIVTGTGVVTGVSPGSVNIIYTLTTGCTANRNVTVSPLPTSISGITNVCLSSSSALSDGTTGGIWTSSNSSVATVDPASGLVSGVTTGISNITYSLGAGCSTSTSVSVVGAPPAITGTTTFCIGVTAILSDAVNGGVWSSSNTSVATVLAGSGHVTGVTAGTSIITYSIGTGCAATTSVVVNPLPSVISGVTSTCVGATTTLSDATNGGTWSSNNTLVATINSGSGVVIGFSSGTTNITYSLGAGCTVTTSVTIGSLPSSISGTPLVCIGFTTTLSDATSGGTWSSGNTSVATVDPGTGVVSGVSAGSSNIVYTSLTGCPANRNVTVIPLPSAIIGNTTVCLGSSTLLSDTPGGGTWSSGSTAIATAVSGTGSVTGVSTGIATITYALAPGCVTTTSVSVIALPTAIAGNTNVCIGSTTTLSDAAGAGSWSSSNTAIATIDPASGIVTGVAAGNAVITYSAGTGCSITTSVTVHALPATITGAANVCILSSTTLSDAGGGTWSSDNTGIATIGLNNGVLSGLSTGVVTITYTLGTGCIATTSVNIIPLPSSIAGTTIICSGTSAILSDAASGGTWSSSNTLVASINVNSGLVTGGNQGSATIFYKLGSGCATSTSVTVNPLPSAITGVRAICEGLTTTLSDAGGGTWSSGSSAIAGIGSSSGIVTGNSAGTAVVTYMLSTGCSALTTVTVNPLPSVISGNTAVCAGLTTTLSDGLTGGTWSSGSTNIATITTGTGVVSGIIQGASLITYKLSTGCLITTSVTVNPLPSSITGVASVCAGLSTTLSDNGGGTWSSSNSGIAAVDVSMGVVSGISAGTARITYLLGTGCLVTRSVTVNPLPAVISGITGICVGTSTTLSDGSGGLWSSGSSAIATINAGGVVGGVAPGQAAITYTLGTGCIATTTVTVNSLPSLITGTQAVCVGLSTALSDGGGGVWSSGSTGVAIVGISSGVISGINAGTARITYSLGTGCITVATVTVNPLPSSITGPGSVCIGSAITLSDPGGGAWSSGNTGIATAISGTGSVTGVSAGAAIITYKLSTGCLTTTTITVNPIPATITGITTVCAGSSTMLSDAVSGGTWSSSSTGVATIVTGTGAVSGISSGTTRITYALGGGCITISTVTVQTTPGTITGSAYVCLGSTTGLNDFPTGGVWSSSNTSVAIISSAGVVTSVTPGATTISYSLGSGCTVYQSETVYPNDPITGITLVCAGQTTDLTDAIAGGTWTSNNNTIAVVNASGTVTGVSGGVVTINYTSPLGCTTTIPVTVNPSSPIVGTNHVCVGFTTTMNNALVGGTWSSDNTAIATINSSGVVTGVTTGIATINYLLTSGCMVTFTISVNPIPVAITGNPNVCVGATTYLSDATGGGAWGNSSPSGILAIGGSTGAITGLSIGTEVVTYTAGGCITVTTVTVPPPPLGISGISTICAGSATSYTDLTPGGAWSTGNTSVATIDGSGSLTAVSAGVSMVSYTTAVGCITTVALTVDPIPPPIVGATDVCAGGATTTVSDAIAGGTWTSNIVTVSATGVVTGVTSGMATITYTLHTGCFTTALILVNPLPSGITGNMDLCPGTSTMLSDTTPGGVWSSNNTLVATIDQYTGNITGIIPGTVTVSYTIGTGCTITAFVTVHPLPPPITGNMSVCVMSTTTLSDATGGGNWSSGAAATATVGASSGVVTGVAGGNVAITYTLPTGCFTTASVTVNALPIGVTGINRVCIGGTTMLSDFPLGGTWSSANTSIAVVGLNSGIVSGVSVSVTTLTYTIGTGCIRTVPFTVNPMPPAITGPGYVCSGATMTLSDASGGGTWSSGSPGIASVGLSTGVVTGGAASTATITYTLLTGCTASTSVTVLPLPALFNVTGGGSFCSLDTGFHIGLSGSAVGFTYRMYRSSALINTLTGTGAALDFGLQNTGGTYVVTSTNDLTGCSVNMSGSGIITVIPAVTPTVSVVLGTTGPICTGTITEFVAVVTGGGTSTLFQWQVNGLSTSTINPYHYIPSNGDVITCNIVSNATCATGLNATGTYTISVTPYETPLVSIAASPAGTVCTGTRVTYLPTPIYGGTAPVYNWKVNGSNISTGSSYRYTPLDGDSVACVMISNYTCLHIDSAHSNDIIMSVSAATAPSVTVTAVPGTTITQGQSDTLTATVTNAGSSPTYQWFVNGVLVSGATGTTYISSSLSNNDSVSCTVVGSGACESSASDYVIITMYRLGVTHVTSAGGDIHLVPNPNKGEFTISGSLTEPLNSDVSLEITDMLGQVVYRNTVIAKNGKINEHISLGGIANGMYLFDLRSANEHRVFHFVVTQ